MNNKRKMKKKSISEKKRMKLNPLNIQDMEKCDPWKLSL
jgi:hypothetical protein